MGKSVVKKLKNDNEMVNFYEKLNSKYTNKGFNPNKGKTHNIDIRFRMCIIGASGSGKSNALLNVLKKFNGTFSHVYLCVKNINEPLYQMLVDKLKDNITVYEDGVVPDLKDIPKIADEEQLIIFDDLVQDKEATPKIIEYFKRSRKDGNFSCIYLSQSYFRIDKFIRQNTNWLMIKKVSSKRDLKLILSDFSLNCDIKDLEKIYNECTKKYEDIMLISLMDGHIYKNFMEKIL